MTPVSHRYLLYYLFRLVQAWCGVWAVFLFLALMLLHLGLLCFASRQTVQAWIYVQQSPCFIIPEWIFVLLPLVFHFIYAPIMLYQRRVNVHHYGHEGNWRYVFQTMGLLCALALFGYHLFVSIPVYFGSQMGSQYSWTIIQAHRFLQTRVFFWGCLVLTTYYFVQGLWSRLIDRGTTASRLSQKWSLVFVSLFFLLVFLTEVFLMGVAWLRGTGNV